MKIERILTPTQSRQVINNIKMTDINDIKTSGDFYDKNTGIEYPTEDEMFEAHDELEME